MPRPGPRRTALAVKVSADELADIDRFAASLCQTRSTWVRNALRYAIARAAHQPTITGD